MTKRQQLYYMLEEFIRGGYDVSTFCDAYHDVFYPDIPYEELSEFELHHFEALGKVTARFSPHKEDHELCPGAFFTENDVIKTISLVYSTLVSEGEDWTMK